MLGIKVVRNEAKNGHDWKQLGARIALLSGLKHLLVSTTVLGQSGPIKANHQGALRVVRSTVRSPTRVHGFQRFPPLE